MEILFKNIPSGICWTSDFVLSLIIQVQRITGTVPRMENESPIKDGEPVYAVVSKFPEKLTDDDLRLLAKGILWFMWCHGFNCNTYVVFRNDLLERRIYGDDFPDLLSMFFPSRK